MMDYKKISKSFLMIAIGNAFILLDFGMSYSYNVINKGIYTIAFDLFPDFIGYILMIAALSIINKYDKTVKVIKPLAIFLLALDLFGFISDNFMPNAIASSNLYSILDSGLNIITVLISIYFYYQIFTIVSSLCYPINQKLGSNIKTFRNVQIGSTVYSYLQTLVILMIIDTSISESLSFTLAISSIVLHLVCAIWSIVVMIQANRLFKNYVPIKIAA